MKLKYKILIIYIFLLPLMLYPQNAKKQKSLQSRYGFEVKRRPPVNYTVFVDYNDSTYSPTVYISFSIQYDIIQFEKNGDSYEGGLQLTASIMQNDQVVTKETWKEKIILDSYDKTNAKDYQLYIYHFKNVDTPKEGEKFQCVISVMDIVTRKAFIDKRDFEIKKFDENKVIIPSTKLIFLLNKPKRNFPVPINPNDSILDYGRSYYAYFRLLENIDDSLNINIRIYKDRENDQKLIKQIYRKAYGDSVVIEIPTVELAEGKYKLSLSGQYKGSFFKTKKSFSNIWYEKPIYLYKYDLALRPMKLILTKDEMEQASDLSDEELEKWFKAYWKGKDPTPDTDYNEIMDEFYKRVDEVNAKYYRKFKEGWETDQGKIFVLFGKPKKIINRRYTVGKPPYEIWEYNNGKEKYIFVDEDKDGEFILVDENGG